MASLPFAFPMLADSDPLTAWAHRPTTDFPGRAQIDSRTTIIVPVYGHADHGLGLSLDVEEVLGAAVLRRASKQWTNEIPLLVLPPIRFALAPSPPALGALDPETSHEFIREVVEGIQSSGYRKIVFWSTSPWNGELIDAASRDARVDLGLQTFVIEIKGVGLNLHPSSSDRSVAQAIVALQLEQAPELPPLEAPTATDSTFRPGKRVKSPPVQYDTGIDAVAALNSAADQLAGLLGEIDARAPLGRTDHRAVAVPPSVSWSENSSALYPSSRRTTYLPALTANQLSGLPAKSTELVVIPVGAIEQHGAHLPVSVDAMIAESASIGLASRLGESHPVWFGPSITYGKSNEHDGYPGTISISARTLRRVVRAVVMNLHDLGFCQFALLNTHGGNSAVLVYTLRELQMELDIRAGMLRLPSSPELSEQENTWGFHAGEWETSVMLAIAPELVRMTKAICHYPAHLEDPGSCIPKMPRLFFRGRRRILHLAA